MTDIFTNPTAPLPPRGPDLPISSFGDAVSAAFGEQMQSSNFNVPRKLLDERGDVVSQAIDLMGRDSATDLLSKSGFGNGSMGLDAMAQFPEAQNIILNEARRQARQEPDGWKGVDLTDEGIQNRVNARLTAEKRDYENLIAMTPKGQSAARLLGGIAGSVADVRQVPFMLLGGGEGSIIKFLAKEAFWNAAGEAVTLPSQFDLSKRLGEAPPNVMEQLAYAAIGGAALGAAGKGLSALGRAWTYFRDRGHVEPLGASHAFTEAATGAAEDAVAHDADPVKAAHDVLMQEPRKPTPEADPAIRTAEQAPTPVQPHVAEQAAPDAIRSPVVNERVKGASAALDAAIAADHPSPKPLMAWLKRGQPYSAKQVAKAGPDGLPRKPEDVRIDPEGNVGQALKSQDITPKTMPGIWKKGGRGELDNIPASEMEETFPGIRDATGTPVGADYLDHQGLTNLLIRDAGGDKSWLHSHQAVMQAEKDLAHEHQVAAQEIPPFPSDHDPEGHQRFMDEAAKFQGESGAFASPDLTLMDDPTGPRAQAHIQAVIADMEARALAGETGFGDTLDQINDLDQMEREYNACMIGGAPSGE